MIQRKVLIVDDELQAENLPRDDTYLGVIEQLNKISPHQFIYEPILCGTEEQLRDELQSVIHSSGELLSIIDLVLDEDDRFSEVGTTELLEKVLQKSRLTFFTTRRLEDAKISTLVKFQRANRSAGLFPFELLQEQPREFARLIHRGLGDYDEGKAIDHIEHLQKHNISDVNVLLISDFHFNASSIDQPVIDLQNTFEKIGDVIGDRRLDMVFLLGDFTDKGIESGFASAYQFVKKLSSLANFQDLPSDFIRIVPGNHDVVVPLTLSANLIRDDGSYKLEDSPVDSELKRYGIQPFHHFRETLSKGLQHFGENDDDVIISKKHWVDLRWTMFGFVLVGFDSNSHPTTTEQVSGSIASPGLTRFRQIIGEIQKARRSKLVLIVLTHHYTGDGGAERGVMERDELRKHCSELGFSGVVFINGDKHGDPIPRLGRQLSNDGTVPLEIAVPTFCQDNRSRQEGASRGSILLNLRSNEGRLQNAEVSPFSFQEGGILNSPEPKRYYLDKDGWRKL